MAKGGNPAAAERKRLEKKQQAKNKEQKAKAQEVATVKKDTRGLEQEVKELQEKATKAPLGKEDREELDALRAELDRVKAAKDAYLEQHPEHKKFVYPHNQDAKRRVDAVDVAPQQPTAPGRAAPLLQKNGLPKYPERSVYYDPVFNPTGAPPPGMLYREKPPNEWPGSSTEGGKPDDDDSDEEGDDDIAMPEGPAPESDEDSGTTHSDLEDIAMPEGPPPPKPPKAPKAMLAPPHLHLAPQQPLVPPVGFPIYSGPPPGGYTGPPPGFPAHIPPPGYGLPGVYTGPPPPMHPMQPYAQPYQQHRGPRPRPPPMPPNAISVSASAMIGSTTPSSAALTGGATMSAAPQLRDLKREATEFVPAAVRKKRVTDQARAAMGLPSAKSVNAAPGGAED